LIFSGALFAAEAYGQTSPITAGNITVRLQRVAVVPGTIGAPLDLEVEPNDPSDRLFVAGQNGQIRIIKNGALLTTPFFNTSGKINLVAGSETGLLGFAFHPNFNAAAGTPGSGMMYTYTSETRTVTPDFNHPELVSGNRGDHQSVIREWTASATNPDLIDTSIASRVLMRINEPQSNHNGGQIRFGADASLYIALGDGGGGNDNNNGVTDPIDGHTNNTGNAQDLTNVYGKLLRIDPLGSNSGNGKYGIPSDNPFVNSPTAVKEVYAYGLRNPFRFSFDKGTGKLYVADVGQDQREEIDIVTSGGNYGWVYREGTRVNRVGGAGPFIPPVAEYTHGDGNAVIGGFVYHGALVPELDGKYIFGDLAGNANRGRLFYTDAAGGLIKELRYDAKGASIAGLLHSIGEDESGEIYAMFSNGDVLRIIPEPGSLSILALAMGIGLVRRPRHALAKRVQHLAIDD
jgi:glucose/arabinose dehydrogenase